MSKIPFTVSARTARLIGRENVANAEGAIIELVKNAYDADATACIIFFDNAYNSVPKKLSSVEFEKFSKVEENDLITNSYRKATEGNYFLDISNKKTEKLLDPLTSFFRSINSLYILDNGIGMDEKVIKDKWMMIGTDSKELEYETDSGRIKAGAKGIGRFALDRLGEQCEVYTIPKGHDHGFLWKVDWRAFEKKGIAISNVKADLEKVSAMDLQRLAIRFSHQNQFILSLLDNIDFSSGTLIKIHSLRSTDNWDKYSLDKLFNNLELLVPPREESLFNIHLCALSQPNEYGKVNSFIIGDYDYKVSAKYSDNQSHKVLISVYRNELNKERVKNEYQEVFLQETMKGEPQYSPDTFQRKEFILEKSLTELVPARRFHKKRG